MPYVDNYIEVTDIPPDKRIRVSFEFRSYNPDGLLLLTNPTPGNQRFIVSLDPLIVNEINILKVLTYYLHLFGRINE